MVEKSEQRRKYKREWALKQRRKNGVKPAQLAPCGTPAAYRRHLRNSETVDHACQDAWNRKARDRRRLKASSDRRRPKAA